MMSVACVQCGVKKSTMPPGGNKNWLCQPFSLPSHTPLALASSSSSASQRCSLSIFALEHPCFSSLTCLKGNNMKVPSTFHQPYSQISLLFYDSHVQNSLPYDVYFDLSSIHLTWHVFA